MLMLIMVKLLITIATVVYGYKYKLLSIITHIKLLFPLFYMNKNQEFMRNLLFYMPLKLSNFALYALSSCSLKVEKHIF